MKVDLDGLREVLAPAEVLRFRNEPIHGLADHGADVEPGDVFFAVPGTTVDGSRFATEAVGRGAVAVVADRPLPVVVPCWIVDDVRRAAGRVAAEFFRHPSRRMAVLGITGTNGKTTVSDLLRLCLEDDEHAVGSLGTISYNLGPSNGGDGKVDAVVPARTTTPGPIEMQRYLRCMADRGVGAVVLEASSHALDQGRTDAVEFDAAVFTNLTRDHLDYHGSMQAYAASKERLFGQLRPGALAVLPADDPTAVSMREAVPPGVRIATWELAGGKRALPAGDVHVIGRVVRGDLCATRLEIRTPEGSVDIALPLVGEHNARNALAAVACAVGLGIGSLRVADALTRARPVRGRLEPVNDHGRGIHLFVDYAHTPDALKKVLMSLRPLTGGRLRVLFGCGGERDEGKRPSMGRIAAQLADHVVVTHDNPRREDPERILQQIVAGAVEAEPSRAVVDVCADRRAAIAHILTRAGRGDTVVLAGKGHELGQTIGGRVLPFDDREEAELWLAGAGTER